MTEQTKAQAERLAEVVMDTIEAQGRINRDDLVQALAGALVVEPAAKLSKTPIADAMERAWAIAQEQDGMMVLGGDKRAAGWCDRALTPIEIAREALSRIPRQEGKTVYVPGSILAAGFDEMVKTLAEQDKRRAAIRNACVVDGPNDKWTKVEK